MMVMAGASCPTGTTWPGFLERYHAFWHRAFAGTELSAPNEYAATYGTMAPELAAPLRHRPQRARPPASLAGCPGSCAGGPSTAAELRDRVTRAGRPRRARLPGPGTATGTARHRRRRRRWPLLLSPYLHMTNNRLRDHPGRGVPVLRAGPGAAGAGGRACRPVRASGHRDRPGHAAAGPAAGAAAVRPAAARPGHRAPGPRPGQRPDVRAGAEGALRARAAGRHPHARRDRRRVRRPVRRAARRRRTGASCSGC